MSRPTDWKKRETVEVCVGGQPIDPKARWARAEIVKVYSRGVRLRSDAFKNREEIDVPFDRIRKIPESAAESVTRGRPAFAVGPIETIEPAPTPPPRKPSEGEVLLAEAEAALALASEPLRKLEARIEHLVKSRVSATNRKDEAMVAARQAMDEEIARIEKSYEETILEIDAELKPLRDTHFKLNRLLRGESRG